MAETIPVKSPPAATPDVRHTVLVVDDTDANRYAVSRWLRSAGYDVIEAATGAEALEQARTHPDLMVLDVRLPDTSGFEVLRTLRGDPMLAEIPVIHLSASFTTSEWRTHGLEAGADAFLTHPVEPRELVATVRSLLRVREAEKRVRTAAREWRATFDALDHGVVLLDDEGRVIRCNRSMATLLGRDFPQIIARPIGELVGRLDSGLGDRLLEAAESARRAGPDGVRMEVEFHGRWFALSVLPVRTEDGAHGGVVCVLADITERTLLLERERAARGEADAANRAKSEFLATMSHEIRTPINAIMGYTDLLEFGIGGGMTETQRDYLTRLKAGSAHLLGLVNDVLDLAKVDAGELVVLRETFTTRPVIEAALTLLRPQAEARGIRPFGTVGECNDVPFVGDDHRVRQVLVNMLSNAVKFTGVGGSVTVSCGVADQVPAATRVTGSGPWTFIRVTDSGIGIAPDKQAAVFEPFVQAESGTTRTKGGTGLGLTISRRLARLMGGDLTLESAPGDGSSFTLWLPAPEGAETAGDRAARSDRPASEYRVHGLAEVGAHLREHLRVVLDSFVGRLRADARFGGAAALPAPLLENHFGAFLGDVAQQLIIIEETGGQASELFRDGTLIQQTIAELHGRQRVQLGWNEEQIEHEFELLAAEVDGLVRRYVPEGTGDVTTALAVLRNLVRVASATSVRAAHQSLNAG